MKKFSVYANLFWTFAKIGAVTFGGGLAMMPIMKRELIEKRGWMTEDELIDYYAIGQSTPGVIAVNVSTFIGYKQAGISGGIVGTLGIVTPSVIIICLIAKFLGSIDQFPLVQKALRGINVSVAALLTYVVASFSSKTVKGAASVAAMLASFALIYFLDVPTYWIILGSAALGVLIWAVQMKIHGGKK